MRLIITIDTEEDNWSRYSTSNNTVENIEKLPALQSLFDQFGAKPTYLVTYPVATNPRSVAILKKIIDAGNCEIGMHCHPWNTPPFDEDGEIVEKSTMLCNLPDEVVFNKLSTLHRVICENIGVVPVSFRSGRWGFGVGVSSALSKLGYRIDTSVASYINWNDYSGPDFSSFGPEPYRFNPDNFSRKVDNGRLLQVPATVGFLQSNFELCQKAMGMLEKKSLKKLHLKGLLYRAKLLNKVWLSPELSDADMMIKLAKRMNQNGYPCINMSFHSTSLLQGLSPFVRNSHDEQNFMQKIKKILQYSNSAGWMYQTLTQYEKSGIAFK